jgi:hypothetical protein
VLYTLVNSTLRPKTATDSSGPKAGHLFTETQHPWYHSEDEKYCFLCVKFDVKPVIFLPRKFMPNKVTFFGEFSAQRQCAGKNWKDGV